ncbi:MAG: hypothetical protein ACUVRJ_07210, partial [Candidatus Villigracilaceae bacterium]
AHQRLPITCSVKVPGGFDKIVDTIMPEEQVTACHARLQDESFRMLENDWQSWQTAASNFLKERGL